MRQTDTQQFTCFAGFEIFYALFLFCTQIIIANGLHRLVPSGMIIARVIFPTQCGLVWELFFFDEINLAQLGCVHIQLNGQNLDHAFDEINGLGHTERTPITYATRGFVRVNTIHF